MANRLYLSKLIGNGSKPDPYRPAWRDILSEPYPDRIAQAIDSERYNFWIGVLDTDASQHDDLIVDNRIQYVPAGIVNTRLDDLTVAQTNILNGVFTWIGFGTGVFTGDAIVEDVLLYMVGHICWKPVDVS